MPKKKAIRHYTHTVETIEGIWKTIYEKIDGNNRSIGDEFDYYPVPDGKDTEKEIMTRFQYESIKCVLSGTESDSDRNEFIKHNEALRIKATKIKNCLDIIDKIRSGLNISLTKGDPSGLTNDAILSIDGFKTKLAFVPHIDNRMELVRKFSKDFLNFGSNFIFAIADEENKFMSLINDLSEEIE